MSINDNAQSARESFGKASESISDAAQKVKKQAEECSEEVIEYIKESPCKAVLIAAAVGLLLGKFLL